MRQLLALPLALVTGVALVACNGTTTTEPDPLAEFHGDWHADQIGFTADADGTLTHDAYAAGDRFDLEVRQDGTFTQTYTWGDGTPAEIHTGTVTATPTGLNFAADTGETWTTTTAWDGGAFTMTRAGVQHDFQTGAGPEGATMTARMHAH